MNIYSFFFIKFIHLIYIPVTVSLSFFLFIIFNPSLSYTPLFTFLLSERTRTTLSINKLVYQGEFITKSLCLHQELKNHPRMGNRIQNVNTGTIERFCLHFQGNHRKILCNPHVEVKGQSVIFTFVRIQKTAFSKHKDQHFRQLN